MTTEHRYTHTLIAALLVCAVSASCSTDTISLGYLTVRTSQLRTRIEHLQRQGIDIAYPMVDLTVLEQFADFAAEDLAAGKQSRARLHILELLQVLERCTDEVRRLESGFYNPLVPRYMTSRIDIDNGALFATVRWPDGTEESAWPVIFTGYVHSLTDTHDLELMHAYGMHILQVETGPSLILPFDNSTDTAAVTEVVTMLDRARDADISINLLLSPDYFPQWAYDRWPDTHIGAGEYIPFSVDSDAVRSVLAAYLQALVPAIAGHPALHSLCLTNEPSYFDATADPENRSAYTAWLQQQYGTVDEVVRAHGRSYAVFDDVPVYPQESVDRPIEENDLIAMYDYYRFNDERFAAFHAWMADVIHDISPDIPVHVKISDYTFVDPFEGIDPGQFDEFSQIAGNDAIKLYSGREDGSCIIDSWVHNNVFIDLLRSLSGKPTFNSENHPIGDTDNRSIPADHIRNVIWQAAVHGQAASCMWVWLRSIMDESSGEDIGSFTGIMHRPAAAAEHGRTALDLLRLGREVHAMQTSPARTAVIYSASSLLYEYFSVTHELALLNTCEALYCSGEKIDFLTEQDIAGGAADSYAMVFAPGVTHMTASAYDGLSKFIASGGQVITVGEGCFAYDNLHRSIVETLTPAAEIFDSSPDDLQSRLLPLLESLPGGFPVSLINTRTGRQPRGVDWQQCEYGGGILINITNYTRDPVTIRIEGLESGTSIDLFTMEPVDETLTVDPLQVYFIQAAGT